MIRLIRIHIMEEKEGTNKVCADGLSFFKNLVPAFVFYSNHCCFTIRLSAIRVYNFGFYI